MRAGFPNHGLNWEQLEQSMSEMTRGDIDWRRGRSPLYVFYATDSVYEVGQKAFMRFFSENALGGKRAFHSVRRMETEVVDMALSLFNGPEGATGTMTTGGSESIFMAVRTCREWFRATRPSVKGPLNIVAPDTVHPAFDKAAHTMDMEVRRVALRADRRGDPQAMQAAMDANTMMLVGSAPCFPHGVIDPIADLSRIAQAHDTWLHVDACVGGYIAPFFKRIGRDIPDFDFALPGVRSLSADLHKFGFCPKPASTVFYRHPEDFERGVFDLDAWPSGRFITATLTGTRPGGAVAGSWAVLKHLGEAGYMDIARRLSAMVDRYVAGIEAIDDLQMWARPDLTIINYGSPSLDSFAIAEHMQERGWLVGLTRRPKGLHAMMSAVHDDACASYLADLEAATVAVRGAGAGKASIEATY